MKVGTLAYATKQGLGILAKSFYDAGVVNEVAIIAHGSRENHFNWYPNGKPIMALNRDRKVLEEFCSKCDLMLFFETPFLWDLIPFCRSKGIATVLMPMYECLPHHSNLPQQPDHFICPSLLDLDYFPFRSEYIPVPVTDWSKNQWRQRNKAEVFVHNAGWGGLKGRNGTKELLQAIRLVKSPAQFIIRSQCPLEVPMHFNHKSTVARSGNVPCGNCNINYVIGTVPEDHLYDGGDVFVFPERFNGLCLPLAEARAAGMGIITTYRKPNLCWLPDSTLVSSREIVRNRVSPKCVEFDDALPDPKAIAAKVDEMYGTDISEFSLSGKQWATDHSWEALKPMYLDCLDRVKRGNSLTSIVSKVG